MGMLAGGADAQRDQDGTIAELAVVALFGQELQDVVQ